MKRLFLISLLMIILTIGAVSASEDLENTTDSTDINAISEEVEIQDSSEGDSLDLNDTRMDSNMEVYYPEELNLDYVLYERQIGEPGDVDFMIMRDTTYENIIISNVPNDITGILRIHYDDNDHISQSVFLKQGNPSNFTRRGPENFVEGNHTIHVDYTGDDNYKPFNKTINYYSGRVTSHILDGHNILVLSVDSRENISGTLIIRINGSEKTFDVSVPYDTTRNYELLCELGSLSITGSYEIEVIFNGTNMNNDTVAYHKKMTFKPPYGIKLYGNEVGSDGLLIFRLPEECKDFTKVTIDDKEYQFYSYYNNEFAINVSDLSEGIYDISITCFGNGEIALKQINDTIIVNNPSSIDDNPPIVSPVGDLDDLNNAINGCNESDIYLDRDYYLPTPDFFRGLEIKRQLTIHGNGHKISIFGCSGNIFNVTANNVSFENIIFIGGLGDYNGGAINGKSTAINCTFNNFMARNGGAMYGGTAINCIFNNNQAISGSNGGAIYNGTAINCIFNNNEAYNGGAMYGGIAINCIFNDNHAYNGGAIYNGTAINCTFSGNYATYNQWIPIAGLGGAIYNGTAINCTFNNNQADIEGFAMYCGVAKYCIFNNNTYYNTTIFKYETVILAPSISTTYNSDKYFVATLKDENDNPIKNTDVQFKFNGKTQTQKTDKNGQVKLTTNCLAPKTYTASIVFKGNDKYTSSSAGSKIVIKKATPKITAKAKTFKKSVKTKKYTMTLKANSKALKNKYVYLKINGKTFKAKTNAKGQTTFKITKLTKKGTHKTTITFKGDKYYNKKVANTKITIK